MFPLESLNILGFVLFNDSMKQNYYGGIPFVFLRPPRTRKWSGPVTAAAPVLPRLVPCCGTAASPPVSLCLCGRDLCPRAAVIHRHRAFKKEELEDRTEQSYITL